MSGTYTLKKKHNFNLNLLSQFRKSTISNQDFTATFGYNYVFDKIEPKFNFAKRKRKEGSPLGEAVIRFKYRDSIYEKNQNDINLKLLALQNSKQFVYIPEYKKVELETLREGLTQINKVETYKLKAIQFLEALYSYEDFLEGYDALVFGMLKELQKDMQRLDYSFEKSYVRAQLAENNHSLHKKTAVERAKSSEVLQKTYQEKIQARKTTLERLIAHRWMLPVVGSYETITSVKNPDKMLSEVMLGERDTLFRMKDEGKAIGEIELYMINKIIDFYWKESLKHTNPKEFELKYIEKNK